MTQTKTTSNPLLKKDSLLKFDKIKSKHFKPAIEKELKINRSTIKKLLSQKKFTWNNFIEPLDETIDQLISVWSAICHLNSVMGTKEIRSAYEKCLPFITKYFAELSQNVNIYNALSSITKNKEYNSLNSIQKKILHDKLRDFILDGVALSPKKKQRFTLLKQKLAKLGNKFSYNVVDSSQSWTIELNEKQIKGLPENALALGRANAQKKNRKGWLFSLDLPSYHALITFLDSSILRKKIFEAYVTRATASNPPKKKCDNTKIIEEILKIRSELVKLLCFKNYAEYSLATKMAKNTKQVLAFLHDLAKKSLPSGKKELKELERFTKKHGIKKLMPWDLAYYSEKLSQEKFKISQEDLRPYFPEPQVLKGMFTIVKKLYGITVKEKKKVSVWHKDVRFFEIYDRKQKLQGQFYLDLYFRENKRGGAWMDHCRTRYKLKNKKIQTPIAHLVCNFSPPRKNKPALFTHQDVITLLHEFGHCLQHLLTMVDYAAASGTNNVPWDSVELASQLMENWCWEKDSVKLLSKHYKSNTTLPAKILKSLLDGRNFHSAMNMLRQLEFALIDFNLHVKSKSPKTNQIKKIVNEVQKKVRIIPIYKKARFINSFAHIFGGGYAAGYYSYKWAEVLSADIFSKFKKRGIFDRRTGKEFLHCFLETGGSEDPMILFKKFMGRKPKIDALLKSCGMKK